MGLWLAQPKLETGETIRWQSSAGRSVNRWITSGGRLTVTDRRVVFQPNRFDTATGKKPWECPLASVAGFEAVDRDLTALAGGTRKRLGIQTSEGVELFVVNDLDDKVLELRDIFSTRLPTD
jgi:hypothetical protein